MGSGIAHGSEDVHRQQDFLHPHVCRDGGIQVAGNGRAGIKTAALALTRFTRTQQQQQKTRAHSIPSE